MNIIFVVLLNILNLNVNGVISFILNVSISSIVVGAILTIIYYISFKSFRKLVARIIEFIKVKGHYV